MIPMSLKLGG